MFITLRPRKNRPCYRDGFSDSRQSARQERSHSGSRRISPLLRLPIEVVDRILAHLSSSSKLQLAYASRTTHAFVIPYLYRVIDLTSPGQIVRLFGSADSVSQLLLVNRHTRTFNLNMAITSKAYSTIKATAALFHGGKLCSPSKPTTLRLTQKARWSLIDNPRFAAALACFSDRVILHVDWSGPCRLPTHFDMLFENLATSAASDRHREATLHLHLRENEFRYLSMAGLKRYILPSGSTIIVQIHVRPAPKRAKAAAPTPMSIVQLAACSSALLKTLRGARDTSIAETEACAPPTYCRKAASRDLAIRITRKQAAKANFRLDIVLVGRDRKEIAEVNELVMTEMVAIGSANAASSAGPPLVPEVERMRSESIYTMSDFSIRAT